MNYSIKSLKSLFNTKKVQEISFFFSAAKIWLLLISWSSTAMEAIFKSQIYEHDMYYVHTYIIHIGYMYVEK